MFRNGRCTEILRQNSTQSQCCTNYPMVQTAWTPEDYDSGAFFFLRVLGDGVRCYPCQGKIPNTPSLFLPKKPVLVSCKNVDCGIDRTCAIRKGRPKCICSSKCKEGKIRSKRGPICGTDGRSYRNICRLRKRACRRKSHSLAIAYSGTCQSKNLKPPPILLNLILQPPVIKSSVL